jgi:hypothetical protein
MIAKVFQKSTPFCVRLLYYSNSTTVFILIVQLKFCAIWFNGLRDISENKRGTFLEYRKIRRSYLECCHRCLFEVGHDSAWIHAWTEVQQMTKHLDVCCLLSIWHEREQTWDGVFPSLPAHMNRIELRKQT